jgi:integrase/recombinase XerC
VPDTPVSSPPVRLDTTTEATDANPFPNWFSQFLNDRQTRKPSAHMMKAARRKRRVIQFCG